MDCLRRVGQLDVQLLGQAQDVQDQGIPGGQLLLAVGDLEKDADQHLDGRGCQVVDGHLENLLAGTRLLADQLAQTVAEANQLFPRGGVSQADARQIAAVAAAAEVGDVHRGQVRVGHDEQRVVVGPDAGAAQADHLDHAQVLAADLDDLADDERPIGQQRERAEQVLERVLAPRAKARPPMPRPVSTAVMSQENSDMR